MGKAMLSEKLSSVVAGKQLCVGHGSVGADAFTKGDSACDAGVAILGAAPEPEVMQQIKSPVLVIGAELDGFVPFSHFAVARHRAAHLTHCRFALVRGTSHASFASGTLDTDLKPVASQDWSFERIAGIVHDFVQGGGEELSSAEADAKLLATPVVDALKLEGSLKLGHVACNSDWPTNPTCQYPKWPDHSLPLGPSPAPYRHCHQTASVVLHGSSNQQRWPTIFPAPTRVSPTMLSKMFQTCIHSTCHTSSTLVRSLMRPVCST